MTLLFGQTYSFAAGAIYPKGGEGGGGDSHTKVTWVINFEKNPNTRILFCGCQSEHSFS